MKHVHGESVELESALTKSLTAKAGSMNAPLDPHAALARAQTARTNNPSAKRMLVVGGLAASVVAASFAVMGLRDVSRVDQREEVQVATAVGSAQHLYPKWLPAGVGRMGATELRDRALERPMTVLHGLYGGQGFVVTVEHLVASPNGVSTLPDAISNNKPESRNLTWAIGQNRFVLRFNEQSEVSDRAALASALTYNTVSNAIAVGSAPKKVVVLFSGDHAELTPIDSWRVFSNSDSKNSVVEISSAIESRQAQVIRALQPGGVSTTVRGKPAQLISAADGALELRWEENGSVISVRSRLGEPVVRKIAESLAPTTDATWEKLRTNAQIESVVPSADPLVSVLFSDRPTDEPWTVVAARGFDRCLNLDIRIADEPETVCVPTTGTGLLAAPSFEVNGVRHRLLVTDGDIDAVGQGDAHQATYSFVSQSLTTDAYQRFGVAVLRDPSNKPVRLYTEVVDPDLEPASVADQADDSADVDPQDDAANVDQQTPVTYALLSEVALP